MRAAREMHVQTEMAGPDGYDPRHPRHHHGFRRAAAAFQDQAGIKIVDVVDIQGKPQTAFDSTAAILSKDPKKANAVVNRANIHDKIIVAMDTDQGTLEWVQKGIIAATVFRDRSIPVSLSSIRAPWTCS